MTFDFQDNIQKVPESHQLKSDWVDYFLPIPLIKIC
jgi:hypothetical protein